MSDVIIAIVPAPGHEGLVAEGPRVLGCKPERPMLLRRCSCGSWLCPSWDGIVVGGLHHPALEGHDVALVLYAPGGPRLGMVRAMEALDVEDYGWSWHADQRRVRQPADPVGATLSRPGSESLSVVVDPWPLSDRHTPAAYALVLAHLLHQRGLASEVLVLPVSA